ncbi:MAG TPA: DNA repair protein RecN [Rhodanobacteraceae bacterium]|nr:DNA repair protein RecN [Rhodanobacteraceae bacterium]
MLTRLTVRNLAVVEAAELELGGGLTVVTGETGAGKSLLVDALMLLSGARADAGMVRAGATRAEVEAEFDLTRSGEARAWLAAEALDEDGSDELRLRRVVAAEGGSRAWINGRGATLAQLAELAALLIEIHGQHEHQALLDRARQLALLDGFGDANGLVAEVRELAQRDRDIGARQRALTGGEDRAARIELLGHELAELDRWALAPDALAALEALHKRLANAGRLAEGVATLAELLDGDGEFAVTHGVARAQSELERLAGLDSVLAAPLELLQSAGIQLGEAAETLARYAQDLDLDPQRYAEVDQHLATLHDLSRRHRVAPSELAAHAQTLRDELATLNEAGSALARLADERRRCRADYAAAASELSRQRGAAARKLGQSITALMGELGMQGGTFRVELEPQPGDAPDPQGRERCEFLVSANPGMPARALRKVASGGELSRIGLAIEVAALATEAVDTMVFDEVDAGIGGAVAETVGAKLRELGARRQVLCVTHLPQVAAQGHAHVAVSKAVEGKTTRTHIVLLDAKARGEEIARMLGGVEIDRETRAHARRMLEKAQST